MSGFSRSPRLLKGAILGFDPANPLASIVVFQYNPDTITRRLEPRTVSSENGDRSESLRLTGPPKETITVSLEVDGTDGLEAQNPLTIVSGIYPTLSALEMLVYPKTTTVIANLALAQLGTIEIIPPEAPLTLFVWGPLRVVPVRLTAMSITEDAHDTLLNPIRAKVELGMQVLNYNDLKPGTAGHTLFLAHQIAKEVLATTNAVNSALNIAGSLKLF